MKGCAIGLVIVFEVVVAASDVIADNRIVCVREEAMSFRDRRDGWSGAGGASFAYTNGEARLSFEKADGQLVPQRGFPGPQRMRGAVHYVLRTDGGLAGEATMCLRCEAKDHGTNVFVRAKAELAKDTDFAFDLDPHEAYYLNDISFRVKVPGQSARLYGIDAVTRETAAEALRMDVETGSPLHIVRDGKNEKAILVLRNASDRAWTGSVHLKIEDFFGNCREGDFPVSLKPGEALRRPMNEVLPKGIRYVTAIASSGGTVATNKTTWAYLDLHEKTPFQPKGEFRLGVNFHGLRMTRGDSQLGMAALVGIGAKMVRSDAMLFVCVRPGENVFDWTSSDWYLESLTKHGLALDAIVWWPAGWAQMKCADGERLFAVRTDVLREYGAELAKRYGDRIAYYEVGNEWDMSNPKTFPFDVATGQVRAVAEGVKSVCPSAKVIPCGFAAESSVRHPSNVIRPMFHENLVRDVQDVVDAHAVHLHAPAKEYSLKIRSFLEWRERMGIRIPWYPNETSLSSAGMRPTDRAMGVAMWQKVLFSMSRGAVDYIWYNLRATGWNPSDSEQGYGIFSADWHPRTGAAAFSALASTFRHMEADGVLFDGPSRQVLRFRNAQDGKGVVIAGWDDYAEKPMHIRVRTDATVAFQVDTMGNRCSVPIADGVALWEISANPSALRLEDASFAKVVESDAAEVAKRPIKIVVPGSTMKGTEAADILLKEYEQVYEVFKAIPEHADRTWRWWGDLWVWVNTAYADGKLKFKITCWDDIHCPVPNDPLTGDCAVLRLGGWKLALIATDKPFVKVLEGLEGSTELPVGSWKLTRQIGYHKVYDFEVDPKSLGLGYEIPFNVRVYDNDGRGFDGWMEYSPLEEEPQMVIRLGI